jgi:archaellum component FlaF (FlaF/FlaG flagellin family)
MAGRAGVAKFGDGVPISDTRVGQQGELIISQLHADGYEQAVRRNTFFSHSIARATSLPATAMIGNIVWNPPDSGVNCAIRRWSSMIHVTSATCVGITMAVGYSPSAPTTTTVADNSGSTLFTLSGATNNIFVKGKAQAFAIGTFLIAPLAVWLLHHNTAAIATTGVDALSDNLESSFIIPPGGFWCMAAQGAAVAAAGHTSSWLWEEIPVL